MPLKCMMVSIEILDLLLCLDIAAVLETDAYQQMKDECVTLQSELLKAVAGHEEGSNTSGGAKSQSVWAQLSDGGGDTTSRHVRQRTT